MSYAHGFDLGNLADISIHTFIRKFHNIGEQFQLNGLALNTVNLNGATNVEIQFTRPTSAQTLQYVYFLVLFVNTTNIALENYAFFEAQKQFSLGSILSQSSFDSIPAIFQHQTNGYQEYCLITIS